MIDDYISQTSRFRKWWICVYSSTGLAKSQSLTNMADGVSHEDEGQIASNKSSAYFSYRLTGATLNPLYSL